MRIQSFTLSLTKPTPPTDYARYVLQCCFIDEDGIGHTPEFSSMTIPAVGEIRTRKQLKVALQAAVDHLVPKLEGEEDED